MFRRWVLPAGLAASLFLPIPASARETPWILGQRDSSAVYGSWSWVETLSGCDDGARLGTPAYCRCGKTLTLHRDGTYEVIISGVRGAREYSSGGFTIHHETTGSSNPAHFAWIWLEFPETAPQIQPSVRVHFAGRDTIVTCDGATDADDWKGAARRFVRIKERSTKRHPRLAGPPPNEYGSIPAETDSSYDTPPVPITKVAAVQSDFAWDAGIAGDVLVHALVQRDGRVGAVTVLEGNPALRCSAMQSVRQWRFRPARKNRHATQAWTRVVVTIPFVPKPVIRKVD